MCMIVIKPKGRTIPTEYLTQASRHNQDGYGISYHNGTKVIVKNTLDFGEFLKLVERYQAHELVLHMRNTSAGARGIANTQPVYLPLTGESFCHNGTISSLSHHKTKSDSVLLAELLEGLTPSKYRDGILGAVLDRDRGCMMLSDGTVKRYGGSWIELDGIHYSSDYYKSIVVDSWDSWYENDYDEHMVFVYGTLKMGYGNHEAFLKDAMFFGQASTIEKYPMVQGWGFPYMYDQSDEGNHIIGEVYTVDADTLIELDGLEGVEGGHYKREQITVLVDGEFEEKVWVYISCQDFNPEEDMIDEWSPTKVL